MSHTLIEWTIENFKFIVRVLLVLFQWPSHLNTQWRVNGSKLRLNCILLICYRYKEVCLYNFDRGGFSFATGHFTQVVWKGSTQLGIGFARGSYKGFTNCLYVVGRYLEPGNMTGAFRKNVLKGSFNKRVTCRNSGNYGKRNKLFDNTSEKKDGHKETLELVL